MTEVSNAYNELIEENHVTAATNNIYTKIDEIRGASEVEKKAMRRRWIWELIQNASDCNGGKPLTIWIKTSETSISFSHNGNAFDYKSLLNLVTQISSKQNEEDEKTGKFGTGFISTHLISEEVRINGLFSSLDNSSVYKNLDFTIDRSAQTYDEMRDSVISTLEKLKKLEMHDDESEESSPDAITTTFTYNFTTLDSEVKKAVEIGLNDLDKTIPYVLTFVDSISEVHCNNVTYRKETEIVNLNEFMKIYKISKTNNISNEVIQSKEVLVSSSNGISVSAMVMKRCNVYHFESIEEETPRLFCQFPLVGTEDFSFPMIINSSLFKVAQERDRIQEGADKNKEIITNSIELYKGVMTYACAKSWNDMYNLCYTNNKSNTELQKESNRLIKNIYKYLPIVEARQNGEDISRASLRTTSVDGRDTANVLIPYSENDDVINGLWDIFDFIKTKPIPKKDCFIQWAKLEAKNKVGFSQILSGLLKDKNIEFLKQRLKNEDNLVLWLNRLYELWSIEISAQDFSINAYVPNQSNGFVPLSKVYLDDKIDDELKDILNLFGDNIRGKLLYKGVQLPAEADISKYTNTNISKKIIDKVREKLAFENSKNGKRSDETQIAFNKLTDWFMRNSDIANELFKDIYESRFILSSKEETIRRLILADKVEEKFGTNVEVDELEVMLTEANKILEAISAKGEYTIEDLKCIFTHFSSNTIYAKEKIEGMINRSIINVHAYLLESDLYDVSPTVEEWKKCKYSKTVFPAKRDGVDYRIIVRPCDDNKIILYEDTEIEALDDCNYELWTNDENSYIGVVTLGDILKTTGITVIPLKKLFG